MHAPLSIADLRAISLFEGLGDDELAQLLDAGDQVPVEPGVELFREGNPADHWWVLVDGALDLVRHVGREDTVVGRMDVPGRWAGGFRAWDEHGVYLATARGAAAGRMLRVPAGALRERMNAWFPLAVHLIGGLYGTARSIESTVRQRESLVTLGTLAAGLAHELNNPAAAATRAVDALDQTCTTLLGALGRLADGDITAQQFLALDLLRQEIRPPTAPSSPLALADLEDDLAGWLESHDVADAWTLAPTLAVAGVDLDWCDRAASLLPAAALGPGLEWVAATLATRSLLAEVREATGRVSELVSSVRSYTQMDRAARQPVDVVEGLESTLVMLGHKVRGVSVVRRYDDDLPRIDGQAGELNQVWTNLIDNALDAMAEGGGTLTVSVRVDDTMLEVAIGDTGHGMPAEVQARAFDAFFTTKEVGKGTGLGLEIARRIVVERHRGTIDIDAGPEGTLLRVRLPR